MELESEEPDSCLAVVPNEFVFRESMKTMGIFRKKQPKSLMGTVVAITGGARGIGRVTTEALVREGARVAIGDIDLDGATATADEIGDNATAYSVDVTDRDSFTAFYDQIEQDLGPIDVLINNAGIMPIGPFVEEEDRVTRKEIDINVHGVIFGTKIAIPRMQSRGQGHILNIASAAGKVGLAGEATYCASKHAVVGLCEALRVELKDTPVQISVVMPSLANTDLAMGMTAGRFVDLIEPEDIAEAIVEAIKYPKFDVYVPKKIGPLMKLTSIMPRGAQDVVGKIFQTDKIGTEIDSGKRSDYINRYSKDGSK